MRLINANKLESEMYHNAFEIDTDLQKWDSGCWIRYKMFENVIEKQPTVKAIPIDWLVEQSKKLPFTSEKGMYIDEILEDWKKENEID